MATNFPTSLDSFTAKANNVDTISAADVNNLQDATVAIETLLGANSARVTTWTPTFTTTGTQFTSVGYASQIGAYARFGSLVYFTFQLQVNALTVGSASGNLQISGLPFSQGASYGNGFVGFWISQNLTANPAACRVNGQVIQMFANLVAAAYSYTNLTSTSIFGGSGFYFHA